VALREGGGYPAQKWKPGTKLSNLHALGIPALCSPEQGCREVSCGAEFWIQSADDVAHAFDTLCDLDVRLPVATAMRDAMLPVHHVAGRYEKWLTTIAR
jgi:hypothetical protein